MTPDHRLATRLAAAALAALLAAAPVRAQPPAQGDGVQLRPRSSVANLVSAEKLENQAAGEYRQMMRQASEQRALAPDGYPQLERLRRISARLIPHASRFNERAPQWRWEVNLIGSRQINAFCMPGGKIAFYTGIIDSLKLTDDEIAMVMGHEMAHALREHGREQAANSNIATGLTIGATVLSQLLGYGDIGGRVAKPVAQLTLLKFSRGDETEADVVGMDLAARAGFDPRAGIKLWEKMGAVSRDQPPQWLSTHPSNETRIGEMRRNLKQTLPLYASTRNVTVAQLPPYRSNFGAPVE